MSSKSKAVGSRLAERLGEDLDQLVVFIEFVFGAGGESIQDLGVGGRLGVAAVR